MKKLRALSHFENGQALLLVIVAMVIILTVSLAVATRTVVNLRTSSEEVESQQAFSAAEAGIERYLQSSTPYSGAIGDASVAVSAVPLTDSELLLNNGNPVLRDDGIDVWLSSYPDYDPAYWYGTMRVYWGNTTDCNSGAIEVLVITGPSADPRSDPSVRRYAFDQCAPRRASNSFDEDSVVAGGQVGDVTFANSGNITITSANPGIIARIIPLYANTTIAVAGTEGGSPKSYPNQGSIIESLGTVGQAQRKITVYQGFPKVPNEFFSHVLFSP